jgi:hypothetical protein
VQGDKIVVIAGIRPQKSPQFYPIDLNVGS